MSGTYYIGAIVDSGSKVIESSENNNSRSGSTLVISAPVSTNLSGRVSPLSPGFGARVTISAALRKGSSTGPGMGGRIVEIQSSPNGVSAWTSRGSAYTDASGMASWSGPAPATACYYRVSFGAVAGEYLSSTVRLGRVLPKVYVQTPKAPTKMSRKKYYTVYGVLKPKHTTGSHPVRVYKWKKTSSGKWKSYGYVNARAYDSAGYTKYSRKMRLKYRGTWRLRAYAPADSGHASAWSSGYDYVKVK